MTRNCRVHCITSTFGLGLVLLFVSYLPGVFEDVGWDFFYLFLNFKFINSFRKIATLKVLRNISQYKSYKKVNFSVQMIETIVQIVIIQAPHIAI